METETKETPIKGALIYQPQGGSWRICKVGNQSLSWLLQWLHLLL